MIGGGNTAVEEALYMTNHSHDVTLIHRRDSLRAEKILQDRLFAHPNIKVMWNREVAEFVGGGEPEGLVAVDLRDTQTGAIERLDTEGAFVAIGHSPATELFKGHLDLDARRLYPGRDRHDPDQRPRRLRLRRRDGQDLPPGGHRRRHRLHGRARCREIPRRGRFRERAPQPAMQHGLTQRRSRAPASARTTAAQQRRLVAGAGEGVGIARDRLAALDQALEGRRLQLLLGGDRGGVALGEDQPGAQPRRAQRGGGLAGERRAPLLRGDTLRSP